MNIKDFKHIHYTGIKGVGMTSLALCAQDLGIKVTGSDTSEVFVTDETLAKRKISWDVGFGRQNLKPKPDLVITTGAHGGLNNPEVTFAKKLGIPVMTHAEALGEIAKDKDTIATCGVGGKTTTASMVATLLTVAQCCPSFAIGVGNIFPLGVPGRYDKKGKHFICEADEFVVSPGIDSRPRFSFLSPKILVTTNIEHDHPDVYPTLADTLKTFKEFFIKIPKDGLLVACIDNPQVKKIIQGLNVPIQTYGLRAKADWRVSSIVFGDGKTTFSLKNKSSQIKDLSINVPGEYNVLNATAAFIVGKFLGIKEDSLRKGLSTYGGCRRRFEKIGEADGVTIYDDYAHHPKEIAAVLTGTREWFPDRRVIAIFQPHTYSRTKALFNDFARAFVKADVVAIMDIYASAREKDVLGVNSRKLAEETQKNHPEVYYTLGHEETLEWVKDHVKKGDIILTMGAGDIFHIHKKLLKTLSG